MLALSHIRPTFKDRVYRVLVLSILVIIMVIIAYPLYFVIIASFSDPKELYRNPLMLWPKGATLSSYELAFNNKDIWIGYRNTLIYTVLGTLINILMTVIGAYPLSRPDFVGRGVLTFFYTFTMFFGGGLIPFFLVCKALGLMNNLWVMIIPGAVSVYNMIIMRTFFQSRIPAEMTESAMIDGASNIRTLFRIVLPLSTPIIGVMVLFYGVGHWNAYFNAMIFLVDRVRFPLQLFLREILVQNQVTSMLTTATDAGDADRVMSQIGLQYVVVIIATLPIFVIYPFMQKFFTEGIMVGALKG